MCHVHRTLQLDWKPLNHFGTSTLVHPTATVRYINNSTIILMICQDHGRSIGCPCSYVLNERGGTRIDDPSCAPEIGNNK